MGKVRADGKTKTQRKGGALASVVRGAGAAAKARGEALVALVERRVARIAEDFYEIGEALRELKEKKLYAAMGYRSFEALLVDRSLPSDRQAAKLIQVVSSVARDQALELGLERAFALVRYTEATPEPDTPGYLLASKAKVGGKPVAQASVRAIVAATKAVRKAHPGKRAKSTGEAEADDAVKRAHAWLAKKGVRGAKVEAKRSRGAWVVRVDVPATEAGRVFR